jgi:catechol 2,3-dioxygenase
MIIRLAHVELAVSDLQASRAFYVDLLGFDVALETATDLYLRGVDEFDAWSLTLSRRERPGLLRLGFRVDSPDSLQELAVSHERLGLPVEHVDAGVEPNQGPAVRVSSPDGHPLEFFHEFDEVDVYEPDGGVRLPMRRTHEQHGIPPHGLDHVNLRSTSPDESVAYWRDELGFSVSERWEHDDGTTGIAWLRRRRISHEVAFGAFPRAALHHVAYNVGDAGNVARVADLAADGGYRGSIEFGPGRHGVSNAMAIYLQDPCGHRLECYSGDYVRDLDRPPITWPLTVYRDRGLMWWGDEPPETFRTVVSEIVVDRPRR